MDANILIAWIDDSHRHHDAALRLVASATRRREQLAVAALTLAEVLVGGFAHGDALGLEALIRGQYQVRVLDTDQTRPLDLARLRFETRLRMPDVIVLEAAIHHRAMLATFDNRMAAAAEARKLLFR